MRKHSEESILGKLTDYFDRRINPKEKIELEQWRDSSSTNRAVFDESAKILGLFEDLKTVDKFNSIYLLKRLSNPFYSRRWNYVPFYRITAILVVSLFLIYQTTNNTNEGMHSDAVTWHKIDCPIGVRSNFELPDGSRIWLNSGTTVEYPMNFAENERRMRIEGEIYLQVTKDSLRPFFVELDQGVIKVLGTTFTVRNYKDELTNSIFLEEGAIDFILDPDSIMPSQCFHVSPNQSVQWSKQEKSVRVTSDNGSKYTDWVNDKMYFRNASWQEVEQEIERYYNVDIQLQDGDDWKAFKLSASFSNLTVEQVLYRMSLSMPFRYEVCHSNINSERTLVKLYK